MPSLRISTLGIRKLYLSELLKNKQEKDAGRKKGMLFYCEKLVCTFTETETLLSTSKEVGNGRVDGIIPVRGSVPDHVNLSKDSIFFSLDFRWDETHPPCEKKFTLLSLLTQTLVSSRNTLSDAPKLMFSKIHGEPVIQSC